MELSSPPQLQIAAQPIVSSLFCRALIKVVTVLAPEAPSWVA
tara:strand:- start:4370 stop:4495 length:126 start_codon:yes stop_codon:yes gene_type:complete